MPPTSQDESLLDVAAERLRESECLVITAGAGMGVDSGLPDFRGRSGLWNVEGGRFVDVSTPWTFQEYPHQGWGFHGHFWNLCRNATPHEGFQVLRRLAQRLPTWVFTSNGDGHLQRAGMDAGRVVECHGSLARLQCFKPCWSASPMPSSSASTRLQLRSASLARSCCP